MTNDRAELEKNLIAGLIAHPNTFKTLDVTAEDFSSTAYKAVYAILGDFYAKGYTWDYLAVKKSLRNDFHREALDLFSDDVPIASVLPTYLSQIRGIRIKSLVQDVSRGTDVSDPLLVARTIQDEMVKLTPKKTKRLGDIYADMYRRIEAASEAPNKLTGVTSGLESIDALTWGFQPSRAYLIAARPSVGKSALCMNIAYNAARAGHSVYVQALEESHESFAARMLSLQTGLSNENLNRGKVGAYDWGVITTGMEAVKALPIKIDDSSTLSSQEICARIRKEDSQEKVSLVIIDHIQQIREKAQSRHLELSIAMQNFKALAKDLKIPVIVVSQLNRGVENRADHRPTMADLKESGDLEAIADVVMLLYRESYYDHTLVDKSKVEINVAKNRDGRTGLTFLSWDPKIMKYR